MNNSQHPFSIVAFDDGSIAVVKKDPRQPRLLEVVVTFFDTALARDYADQENSRSAEPATEPKKAALRPSTEPAAAKPELSARQNAVLKALRSKMDEHNQVAARTTILATAANVPLGSLHSILQSLEKKQLIRTVRAGSARASAVYEIV